MFAKKEIRIYLSERELDAVEDGKVVRSADCLIGKKGHETPVGRYSVLLKDKDKRSRKYDAPMNYSLKFSSDWKAIHESANFFWRNLGMSVGMDSLGSHGCVGLSADDAQWLFEWTPIGTKIFVIQARSK